MAAKLVLVALCLLSAVGIATASEVQTPAIDLDDSDFVTSSCKSTTETIGPCEVHFSICYGLHKLKWRYTATACASDVCASSGRTESAKGAAEEAAKALFAMGPACAKPAGLNSAPIQVILEEPEESFEPRLTSGCKSTTETIGPCSVRFSVCYGFHKLHWRYTATACASGICASSGHTKSPKGAAEEAAKALFAMGPACAKPAALQAEDSIAIESPPLLKGSLFANVANIAAPADDQLTSSCKSTTETIGPCSVHFSVCYGFYKRHWRYTATACASGICASSGHTKSAKGAAEDAAKALFAMGPACAKPAE